MKTARWVPASQEHFRDESLEVKEPDAHTAIRPCCGMVEAMTLIDDARNGRLWQRQGKPVP